MPNTIPIFGGTDNASGQGAQLDLSIAIPGQRIWMALGFADQAHQGGRGGNQESRDKVLGAEGAVIFLDRVSGALEHVDSSSGTIGTAVNRAIETLVPIGVEPDPATWKLLQGHRRGPALRAQRSYAPMTIMPEFIGRQIQQVQQVLMPQAHGRNVSTSAVPVFQRPDGRQDFDVARSVSGFGKVN